MATKFMGVLARRRGGAERFGVNSKGSKGEKEEKREKKREVWEGAIGVVSGVSSDA
jgi:hypothetical protein